MKGLLSVSFVVVFFITILFSAEARYISQEDRKFYGVMFFLTFSTGEETKTKIVPEYMRNSNTTFLSIQESLRIRNKLEEILEGDKEYKTDQTGMEDVF